MKDAKTTTKPTAKVKHTYDVETLTEEELQEIELQEFHAALQDDLITLSAGILARSGNPDPTDVAAQAMLVYAACAEQAASYHLCFEEAETNE